MPKKTQKTGQPENRADTTAAAPPPVLITSIDQLSLMVAAPLHAEFSLDGRVVRIPCRRLTPREEATINAIEREVAPPKVIKGPKPDDDRIDYISPDYVARREEAARIMRAVTLYTACPVIAAGRPGLTDRRQILDHVESLFTTHILDLIHLTIRAGGIDVSERVNFTSPPASAQN